MAGWLAGWLALAGCTPSDSEFCDGACGPGEDIYFCDVPSSNNRVCADSLATASGLCSPNLVRGTVACLQSGGSSTGTFPNWDPDDYIRFNRKTGRVEVDKTLIDDIASNGYVLIQEDSARLVAQSGDYYKVVSVGRDDLAYHLGLRENDVIKSANSIELKTLDDYANAIVQLRDVSLLTLVVERGSSTSIIEIDIA